MVGVPDFGSGHHLCVCDHSVSHCCQLSVFDGKSARFWFWSSLCVCDHSVSHCCQLSVFDGKSARFWFWCQVLVHLYVCVTIQ